LGESARGNEEKHKDNGCVICRFKESFHG
jgi:hypothetical protein